MASFPVPVEHKIVRNVQSVRTYVTELAQSNTSNIYLNFCSFLAATCTSQCKLRSLRANPQCSGVSRVGLRGVSKSHKCKWLLKVGASKGVTLENEYFGWRNVGAMPQICINLLTLAQRWTNSDIQTMFIEQNNILEITNINENM